MADCVDVDGHRPRDVASLALLPLLDMERLAGKLCFIFDCCFNKVQSAGLHLITSSAKVANAAPSTWVSLMKNGGASFDAQDVRGVSPLIAAAVVGDVKSLESLISAGASKPPSVAMPKSGTTAGTWAQYASIDALAVLQRCNARLAVADTRAATRLLEVSGVCLARDLTESLLWQASRRYVADADALAVLAPLGDGPMPRMNICVYCPIKNVFVVYRPAGEKGELPHSALGILQRFSLPPTAAVRTVTVPTTRPTISAMDFLRSIKDPIQVSGTDNFFFS